MANISAGMVKELRDKTGAGMMDCKAALGESGGDLEAAVDWLRKKGLAKAAKKAGRVAAEGLIGVALAANKGIVVEVNSETDFVARNDLFQGLVKMIADVALDRWRRRRQNPCRAYRRSHRCRRHQRDHRQGRREHDAAAGRASVGRQGRGRELRAQFCHRRTWQDRRDCGARIGRDADELKAFGRMVAMHVASANPQAIEASGLDPATVERERNVLAEKFKAQGKPANVIEKIVELGLKTFYKEVCLLDQGFIFDDKKSVAQAVKGSRRQSGRADQGHRLRALCAWRRHRPAERRFRRRSCGSCGCALNACST